MDGWMDSWSTKSMKAEKSPAEKPPSEKPPAEEPPAKPRVSLPKSEPQPNSEPIKDEPQQKKPQDNNVLVPGEDDEEPGRLSHNKFHDFESQFSLARASSMSVKREVWGSQCEFLMSCIASAVGLGNIWRFPFVAGANGGGAFLIPYLIVLTVVGRPLYLMELGLGQFASSGPIKIWEMVPAFRGIGYAATLASFFVVTFYVVIMGWALVYFGYSCFSTFPWLEDGPGPFFGGVHLKDPGDNSQFVNGTGLDGPPVLNVTMGLLASWILVWIVMIGGVSGSGKVAYFTALFPYSVLLILLVAGCTLKGASDGILYFLTPDFGKVFVAKTWFQAVGQCFFSLGISFGGCYMFASYNTFHHKLGQDILIISIMDTFTSILAGTCLFGLIGSLAVSKHDDLLHEYHAKLALGDDPGYEITTDVSSVISYYSRTAGAGLAFVTFPEVLNAFKKYPGLDNFISALFFFMIVVLAVGSANGLMGTIITAICDQFPKWNRRIVVTCLCTLCFFLGLLYTTPSGANIIDIVDKHGSEIVIYILATCEVIGVAWIYGTKNLCNDFEFMLGAPVSLYWVVCWAILPVLMVGIFISYLVGYTRDPKWAPVTLGSAWTLSILVWSVLPITFFIVMHTRKSSSIKKRFKATFYPSRHWGPQDPAVREAWRRFKKTRPNELPLTTFVKKLCGCKNDPAEHRPSQMWATDLDGPYISNTDIEGSKPDLETAGTETEKADPAETNIPTTSATS